MVTSSTLTSLRTYSLNHTETMIIIEVPCSATDVSTSVDSRVTRESQPGEGGKSSIASASAPSEVTQPSSRGSSEMNTKHQQSDSEHYTRSSSAKEVPSGPESVLTTGSTQTVSPEQAAQNGCIFCSESTTSSLNAPGPIISAESSYSNMAAPSQRSIQPQQSSYPQASSSGSSVTIEGPNISGSEPANNSHATSIGLINGGSRASSDFKPREFAVGLILFALI